MGLPPRRSLSMKEPERSSLPTAIHPNLVLVFRFLITGLVCLLSLATAILGILIVHYYNSNNPIIKPSWGSLIYLIILGLFTPIVYFGYNIFLPLMPFINYGDFLYSLFMVKIELLLQFAMCVLWVSGALAYSCDLGGRENCQFDGYLHYPKPTDFGKVCDLIGYTVALAYTTFGVQVFLWACETLFGVYTFLFLDQESLNEPHFEWGRRAYNYQHEQPSRSAAFGARPLRASAPPPAQSFRDTGRRSPPSDAGSASASGSGSGAGRRGAAYADPDMESRTSQPVSLGSRGRRGAAYGGLAEDEDEESHVGQATGIAAAAADGGARPASSSGRRRRSGDEESGWHLKEEDSTR